MAKKHYYAVKKGISPGIYKTWEECKSQVSGFSGAEYKGFTTLEEAESFLGIKKKVSKPIKEKLITKKKEKKEKNINGIEPIRSKADVKYIPDYVDPQITLKGYDFVAFVDGSYDKHSKLFGSGIAHLVTLEEVKTYKVAGKDIWDQWNIVGELEAAKYAIELAKGLNAKTVAIYHDLKNIGLWASGEWKAKNEYTQSYVKFIEEASESMEIVFIKVKGHSQNKYNDIADLMAEEAIKEFISKT